MNFEIHLHGLSKVSLWPSFRPGDYLMNRLCKHCGESFLPYRSVPGQEYCSNLSCQRARKRVWQKKKLASDPDYRYNQKSSQQAWRARNPSYMREYRGRSREYTERNRLQQQRRNQRRKDLRVTGSVLPSSSSSLIVKMDEIKAILAGLFMPFRHYPFDPRFIVKMDEFIAHQQALSRMYFRQSSGGVDCKEMTSSPCFRGLITL